MQPNYYVRHPDGSYSEASPQPQVASAPAVAMTEEEEYALHEALKLKLEGHRMAHRFEVEEDGSHGGAFHLIDRLSIDATDIAADSSTGKEEIESIVDAVFNGAKDYAMSIIAKRIHERACICSKCLEEFSTPQPVAAPVAAAVQGDEIDLIPGQGWKRNGIIYPTIQAMINSAVAQRAASKDSERDAALKFADHIINGMFEGGNWDGGDVQELAVKYGLLKPETMQGPCNLDGACQCAQNSAEFPSTCYRKTYVAAMAAQQSEKR